MTLAATGDRSVNCSIRSSSALSASANTASPKPLACRPRISEIVAGQRAISADTDLRLCRVLELSPGYWLRAQAAHDTEVASAELADELERIQPLVNC